MIGKGVKGAVVFARGALGDSILTWPLLRALANQYDMVALVSDLAKAQLAQRVAVPSLVAMSAEQDLFNRLFVEGAHVEAVEAAASINLVLHLTRNPMEIWRHNAQRQYPLARIVLEHDEINRITINDLAQKWGIVRPQPPILRPRTNRACLFVGAGSAEKRWPLPFWIQLARGLPHLEISLIAGEAEVDRFSPPERTMFESSGGLFLSSLPDLENHLRKSSIFVGVDSGPTHLAAQLGLDTLALFGPTDPAKWAPIGPRVETIAPDYPCGMAWLTIDRVVAALSRRSSYL